MKISANEIKIGNILEIDNKLWKVLKLEHTKPGKGGAYVQAELKEISDGTKKNERFRSDENLEKAYLEQKSFQFLYSSGNEYFFMDQDNYEQISIDKEKIISETLPYLKDGINIILELKDEKPINIILPETVILEIKEAEAVIKGQTATSGLKPAILENGIKVMVPVHIEEGVKIVVKTLDNSYVEKVK
ncbi:MAG: Elongation factor P [Alphaproteobacteria bacterium MarineAlpha6_Bin4]|nr:MAG: Elongation factor P [Alphaproteobacteria bacterium MarineAlpha6_Bin4]|tara:strand:+ start:999 stop:1565 length:567 start_codon:yes stop_codon:yes gene_type:complete